MMTYERVPGEINRNDQIFIARTDLLDNEHLKYIRVLVSALRLSHEGWKVG